MSKLAENTEYRYREYVHVYEAGANNELGVTCLEARSDYTVQVCRVTSVTNDETSVTMVGAYSPATQVTTDLRPGKMNKGDSMVSSTATL